MKYLNVFGCTKGSHHIFYHVIDIGATRPARVSILERRGSHPIDEVEVGGIEGVEAKLAELTMGIHHTTLGEVPYHLQRHIVEVLESIGQFIRRIAQAIMCCNEKNRPRD